MSDPNDETKPEAVTPDIAEAIAAEVAAHKKRLCEACDRPFMYGDWIAVISIDGAGRDNHAVCVGCARKEEPKTVAVYVGGISSSVSRERAAKRLKKLNRLGKAAIKADR